MKGIDGLLGINGAPGLVVVVLRSEISGWKVPEQISTPQEFSGKHVGDGGKTFPCCVQEPPSPDGRGNTGTEQTLTDDGDPSRM